MRIPTSVKPAPSIARRRFLKVLPFVGLPLLAQSSRTPAVSSAMTGCEIPNAAETWSRFRGPNGQGVGVGTGYPSELSRGNILWRAAVPKGKSSPVLTPTRVFITGEINGGLGVMALDRATGEPVWSRTIKADRAEFKHALNSAAVSTPATDGTNVYAFFGDFGLVSYDGQGKERWKAALGPFTSLWGMASSPVLAGNTVVLMADGFSSSAILGFDARTGQKLWETERPPFALNYSTPFVRTTESGQCEVVALGPQQVVGYSPKNGERLWSAPAPAGTIIASPAAANGSLFSMVYGAEAPPAFPDKNGDGVVTANEFPEGEQGRVLRMIALETGDKDGKITQAEWSSIWAKWAGKPAVSSTPMGPSSTTLPESAANWSYQKGVARIPSPLVYDGLLYFVANGGILTSIDTTTGQATKVARLPGAQENFFSSPVAAEGKIYFASESGRVVVVEAGANWKVLSSSELDEECFATPALSNGKVFLRTSAALYAFGAN